MTLKVAEHLYQIEANSYSLCLLAYFLLKNLGLGDQSQQSASFNESSSVLCNLPAIDTLKKLDSENSADIGIETRNLCENITMKALLNAVGNETFVVHDVINWIHFFSCLSKTENPIQSKLFKSLYVPDAGIPSCHTSLIIKESFEKCAAIYGKCSSIERNHFIGVMVKHIWLQIFFK